MTTQLAPSGGASPELLVDPEQLIAAAAALDSVLTDIGAHRVTVIEEHLDTGSADLDSGLAGFAAAWRPGLALTYDTQVAMAAGLRSSVREYVETDADVAHRLDPLRELGVG